MAVFTVSSWLSPGPLENYTSVDNPFGTGQVATVIEGICFGLLGICALASVASLALRFTRSRGIERQQIKWVWAAGAVLVVTFVVSALLEDMSQGLAEGIQFGGLLAVPAAVAVAILRYRLYDIAVVVNRTLVYGSLTAALALVYLASVLLLQLILSPVTEQSSLAVAVSTLAVAGLFRPVRGRIQGSSTAASTGAITTPPGRAWLWPSQRSRSRACSAPCGDGSRSSSTAASTGASTTPPGRSRPSAHDYGRSSTSTAW